MQPSTAPEDPPHARRIRATDAGSPTAATGDRRRRRALALAVPPLVTTLLLSVATPALAADSYAVLAVSDPSDGPTAELAQAAATLRSALRERADGTLDAPTTRAGLAGPAPTTTLRDAARARQRAEAAWEAGDVAGAAGLLRAVVHDLERLPEADAVYSEWKQAVLRLAYLQKLRRDPSGSAALLERLAALEPTFVVDEVQYPPSFRGEFEAARRRVEGRGRLPVAITSSSAAVRAFVGGKPAGTTPVTVDLPPGRYRVAGSLGQVRVPTATVQLEQQGRHVELDAALAQALRADAGPGLALAAATRATGIARAGAALGVTHVVALSIRSEAGARVAAAALHDMRRGTVVREASAPLPPGEGLSTASARAMVQMLLTGEAPVDAVADARSGGPPPTASGAAGNSEVTSRSLRPTTSLATGAAPPADRPAAASAPSAGAPSLRPAPAGSPLATGAAAPATTLVTTPPPRGDLTTRQQLLRWSPVAAGALTVGLGVLAVTQASAAASKYASARTLAPGGSLATTEEASRYKEVLSQGDAARTRSIALGVGAGVALVSTGVLAYLSHRQTGEVGPFRF